MTVETDADFLDELAASFSADSSFDVEDRLRAIAEKLRQSKWTRVGAKKPPKGTLVLCASMEATSLVESFWVGWMAGNAWLRDKSEPSITPTHWMEIPAIIEGLESLSREGGRSGE